MDTAAGRGHAETGVWGLEGSPSALGEVGVGGEGSPSASPGLLADIHRGGRLRRRRGKKEARV